jgi:hypothetical protein
MNVVDAQDVMVQNPFNEVEGTPPHEEMTDEPAGARKGGDTLPGLPQQPDAADGHNPHCQVKKTIRAHVGTHGFDAGRRLDTRQHVVPLQYLVKHDAVCESTQSHTQQDATPSQQTGRSHFSIPAYWPCSNSRLRRPASCQFGRSVLFQRVPGNALP